MRGVRLALTILVLMIAVEILARFFALMDLPSDLSFWGGTLGALMLLVAVPTVLTAIWRKERFK